MKKTKNMANTSIYLNLKINYSSLCAFIYICTCCNYVYVLKINLESNKTLFCKRERFRVSNCVNMYANVLNKQLMISINQFLS